MNTAATIQPAIKKSNRWLGWTLLAGLLILRIPFLGGIAFLTKRPEWVDLVFEIGTYLLIAGLIWLERERLEDYHIDRLALWIIVLFKPIQTLYLTLMGMPEHQFAFPHLPAISFWAIAIGLFIFLWRSGTFASSRKGNGRRNLVTGIIAGLALAVVLSYPMSLQVDLTNFTRIPPHPLILIQPALDFFYQLGYAAVTEEPVFRGFLWGFLRKAGWKDLWILVFQAFLFMVAHIYYLKQAPISFWVIVPVASLLFGFLAWRTRSIVTSMAAHSAGNATTYMAGVLLALYSR